MDLISQQMKVKEWKKDKQLLIVLDKKKFSKESKSQKVAVDPTENLMQEDKSSSSQSNSSCLFAFFTLANIYEVCAIHSTTRWRNAAKKLVQPEQSKLIEFHECLVRITKKF